MKVVVDTNVLFSFFWKDSLIRKILMSQNHEFFSSELAVKELKKYSSLIIKKTKISKQEFNLNFNKLESHVSFLPKKYYLKFFKKAEKISPDKDDAEFLALCLKLDIPLWSDDKKLKTQEDIVILNTKDIIEIYF